MSILVNNIRIPLEADTEEAFRTACARCDLPLGQVTASVYRESLDARRGTITRVLSVLLDGIPEEQALAERINRPDVRYKKPAEEPKPTGSKPLSHRPVVVGLGPAGLFAAHLLAKNGYRPIVLERGDCVEDRDRAVEEFWRGGAFSERSNIQFGEGGAGAYSDGKLMTRIHDPLSEVVLHTLVAHGAPADILTKAKPHIGTDILKDVVRSMREDIIRLGGEVHFRTALTGIIQKNGRLTGILADGQPIPCEQLILAIGHSARDTFVRLHDCGLRMEPKPFSVGARIEHLQSAIDRARYGRAAGHPALPPAEYTLSHRQNGRACYSFCMCPGGHVINAASEENTAVTNGMSNSSREGMYANSGLLVDVRCEDFGSDHPLAGMEFQRKYERLAYENGGGKLPETDYAHFRSDSSDAVRRSLPEFASEAIIEAMPFLGKRLKGFDRDDALMTGVETRSSSPVRILRDEEHQAAVRGIYPAGEGAGYAGGIMSAAVDGIKTAEKVMKVIFI